MQALEGEGGFYQDVKGRYGSPGRVLRIEAPASIPGRARPGKDSRNVGCLLREAVGSMQSQQERGHMGCSQQEYKGDVLVTFLRAETKYPTFKVKGGKVYLAQRFQSTMGWLQGRGTWQTRIKEEKQFMVSRR